MQNEGSNRICDQEGEALGGRRVGLIQAGDGNLDTARRAVRPSGPRIYGKARIVGVQT
jgi:hypothetical protein